MYVIIYFYVKGFKTRICEATNFGAGTGYTVLLTVRKEINSLSGIGPMSVLRDGCSK